MDHSPAWDARVTRAVAFFAIYFLLIFLTGTLVSVSAVQTWFEQLEISRDGWLFVIVSNPIPSIGTLLLALYQLRAKSRNDVVVVGVIGTRIWLTLFVAIVVSVALAAASVWPWEWTNPRAHLAPLFLHFTRTHQYGAIVLFVINGVLLASVCEEVAIRFGLLQWILRRTNSPLLAALISSVIFGLLHLGSINSFDEWALRRVFTVTCFGLVTAYLTLRDDGRIGRALAVHIGRNGIEAFFLVLGAIQLS